MSGGRAFGKHTVHRGADVARSPQCYHSVVTDWYAVRHAQGELPPINNAHRLWMLRT
jgi:hypothetical protein